VFTSGVKPASTKGFGIVGLAGSYVFADIAEGRLVPILEDFNTERKDIWVVHAQKQDQNVNIRTFIHELRKVFKRDYTDVHF
jgi:DNA-binding transcriptional LysR family regulator